MSYVSGSITAVPAARRQEYRDHVAAVWSLLRRHGALRLVETWGVDIQKGRVNDLMAAVEAGPDECVAFGWVEWPGRQAADAGWPALMADPALQDCPQARDMPFDGSRMIQGGFAPIFTAGSDRDAGYFQGFALAVPGANRDPYTRMAAEAWEGAFRPQGCLGTTECWGVDVPHGRRTDFYRASLATEGEVPVFSWTAWKDRAACDAASRAMEAGMEGKEFPPMPFDGMRMMWGGFELLFDSAAEA